MFVDMHCILSISFLNVSPSEMLMQCMFLCDKVLSAHKMQLWVFMIFPNGDFSASPNRWLKIGGKASGPF